MLESERILKDWLIRLEDPKETVYGTVPAEILEAIRDLTFDSDELSVLALATANLKEEIGNGLWNLALIDFDLGAFRRVYGRLVLGKPREDLNHGGESETDVEGDVG